MPTPLERFLGRHRRASKVSVMVVGVDRCRKVRFCRIARKPAPVLVSDRLTVKVTVKVCGAAASALRINSLEGSLMIEWELPKSYAKLLTFCIVLRMFWHGFP